MRVQETIDTFIDFYRERGHVRTGGAPLVRPPGDPVMFTTAGMHPLTPYLRGRDHPDGRRLVNAQRCLRTTDLDEVGDPTHLTAFEMLGSWSLGDYDGPTSLRWGYELLRDGFGLRDVHVTVFGGGVGVPPDTESLRTWQDLGVPVEVLGGENWWDNGPTGPCGPDSEIFVWTGDGPPCATPGTDGRWVEVWNHVMMRYDRQPDGTLVPLRRPNVDTGMGLERLLTVLQRRRSVYECDVFAPWVRAVSSTWTGLGCTDLRVVCDHLRSGVVLDGDGVRPSNTRHGYVLRRLVRRALTALWRQDPERHLGDLPREPIEFTQDHFGVRGDARAMFLDEERRFRAAVSRGRPVVRERLGRGPLGEPDYRYLHDTHGLPRDIVDYLVTS
jgi:alanyl-tRNA synthetase